MSSQGSVELFYHCSHCTKQYKSADGLIKHSEKVHQKKIVKIPEKKPKRIPVKKRRENVKKQTQKRECVICLGTIKTPCVIYPCGHANFCYECVHKNTIQKCPVCRIDIVESIKVYF